MYRVPSLPMAAALVESRRDHLRSPEEAKIAWEPTYKVLSAPMAIAGAKFPLFVHIVRPEIGLMAEMLVTEAT